MKNPQVQTTQTMKNGTESSSTQGEIQETDLLKKILDNPEEFRTAIGQAQMNNVHALEVTDKLFRYLTRDSDSPFITYGDPGIKVYKVGTRQDIEGRQNMTAELYHEYLSEQRKAKA